MEGVGGWVGGRVSGGLAGGRWVGGEGARVMRFILKRQRDISGIIVCLFSACVGGSMILHACAIARACVIKCLSPSSSFCSKM